MGSVADEFACIEDTGDTEGLCSTVFFILRPRIWPGHRKTCWKPNRKGVCPRGQTPDHGRLTPWARIPLEFQQRRKNQSPQNKFCSLVQLQLMILTEYIDVNALICTASHAHTTFPLIPSHVFFCSRNRAWKNHISEPEVEGLGRGL